MTKVSIILLNYNGKKFNKPCIDSILLQDYHDFEIVFVDNASSDGSGEEVNLFYQQEIQNKKIIMIENKVNTGFAGGNNLGVQHASKDSEYICLLNNDTTVPQDRLGNLVKGIQSDHKLGAVGSVVLDKGYEDKIKEKIFVQKKVVVSSVLGESVWKDIPEKEYEQGIFHTSVLSGCSLLYRKSIIDKPFPERYFAYAEDIFFSRMILLKGYKLAMIGDSIVYHAGSGSFGKSPSKFKLFHGNRNQICNFLVFYGFRTRVKLLPLFLFSQIAHLAIGTPLKRLEAKINSRIRIRKNRRKVKELKRYIREHSDIPTKAFIGKLSYKFSDEVFYTVQKKWQVTAIQIVNRLFSAYCRILRIPHIS